MTHPLAGGSESAVHRKDIMPAITPFVIGADQQSPSPRPDVSDSESDNDEELCILPPQNPAPAGLPPVPPWLHLGLCLDALWQRRTVIASNTTAKLPAVP